MNKRKSDKYCTTSVVLDKQILEDFEKLKEEMNFKTISSFIRYLINKELALYNKMTNKTKMKIIQNILKDI